MKYQRFEDLPVWQAAIELGRGCLLLTENAAFKGRYSVRDQIERAAVSVSNNIAEGFERGTNQELLAFLYIARGSVGEVRSMLYLLEGMQAFRSLGIRNGNLRERTESISKQLGAWGAQPSRLGFQRAEVRDRKDAGGGGEGTRAGGVSSAVGGDSNKRAAGIRGQEGGGRRRKGRTGNRKGRTRKR